MAEIAGNLYINELHKKLVQQVGMTEQLNALTIINRNVWATTTAPLLNSFVDDKLINFETGEIKAGQLITAVEGRLGEIEVDFFVNAINDNKEIWAELYDVQDMTKAIDSNMLLNMLTKWLKYQATFWARTLLPKLKDWPAILDKVQLSALLNTLTGSSYWKSTSYLTGMEASTWGSIASMSNSNIQKYVIIAVMDRATCPVCQKYHESEWAVQTAVEHMERKAGTPPDELASAFPFPREAEVEAYTEITQSPYTIVPFHAHCRCRVRAI